MTDYSKGVIYEIRCNIINDVYYGSTTVSLSERISNHKSMRDCTARNIIDRGNFTCKIIEECPCNCKQELEARESYYIRNNECINIQIPGRTKQEWREDNKDKIQKYFKEYNEANKVHLSQVNKEYREDNKVEIAAQKKIYREKNKVEIQARRSIKIQCECGSVVRRGHLPRHCRTKKHLDYISTLN